MTSASEPRRTRHQFTVDRSLQRRITESLLDDIAAKVNEVRDHELSPVPRQRCEVIGSELLRLARVWEA